MKEMTEKEYERKLRRIEKINQQKAWRANLKAAKDDWKESIKKQ